MRIIRTQKWLLMGALTLLGACGGDIITPPEENPSGVGSSEPEGTGNNSNAGNNSNGGSNSNTGNTAPVAQFNTSINNLTVTFDASASSDAEGDSLSYAWRFGDGNEGSGRTITHRFDAAGSYRVALSVLDGNSGKGESTQNIVVQAPQITAPKDDDADGVDNSADKCPNSKAGDQVDNTGCKIEPPTSVTNADAERGATLYQTHCSECHGNTGKGVGAIKGLSAENFTQEILSKFVNNFMPNGRGPASNKQYTTADCQGDCAQDVAAFILAGFPGEEHEEITVDFGGCDTSEGAPRNRALRLLTRHEYQTTVNTLFNLNLSLTTNFPQESRVNGFTNNADTSFVTSRHLDVYYSAASKVAAEATNQQNFQNSIQNNGLNCNSNEQCLERFVDIFGQKIFRRPLSNDEKSDYLAFFKEGVTDFNHSDHFRTAVRQGLTALLMSPNFLYRSELGQKDGSVYRLTQWEIASLIAYTFTGSAPDDELLQRARNNQLVSKMDFKREAERLLDTELGRSQMAHFAAEWWDADAELIGSKNPEIFQGYTPQVILSMVGEMKNFFLEVAFESSGQFDELFNADFTMANSTLAQYYNFNERPNGNTFAKVNTDERGGVLALGAIMSANSGTEETSPIKRGIFIREQLLCDHLPPIPRDVNIASPDLDPNKPVRERFEAHSVNPECWSCHQFIDDMGFSLENFDAAGKYRSDENGLMIRTDGVVRAVDDQETVHSISDRFDLANLLATAESTKACMARQYYRYVGGYSETSADECAISNLNKQFKESNFDIRSLLVAITQLDSFILRQ